MVHWKKYKTVSFAAWANEELERNDAPDSDVGENELPLPQTRRQMLTDGTVSDQENLYEVNVHNVVLDTVISSLKTRFSEHGNLFADLSCSDPNNFSQIKNLPETAFEKISSKVIRFNANATPSAMREELLDFASKWEKLKPNVAESYKVVLPIDSDENFETNDQQDDDEYHTTVKTCKDCAVCCYFVLKKYKFYANAYNSIFTFYQYLLTLPISQVTCEQCFSKLKLSKIAYVVQCLKRDWKHSR